MPYIVAFLVWLSGFLKSILIEGGRIILNNLWVLFVIILFYSFISLIGHTLFGLYGYLDFAIGLVIDLLVLMGASATAFDYLIKGFTISVLGFLLFKFIIPLIKR